jgi:putative tricarboxylic transport membrane protein
VAFANALGNQNHIAAAQVVKGVGANPKALKTVVFNGSGEGVAALLGGHVDAITISASPLLQHVKAGRVRILAVSSDQRLGDVLATVPTWQELGIASISSNWRGLVGPRGMSEGQIAYWDEVFARLSQLPEWRQDLERKLIETTYLNSRDAKRQIDTEYAELSKLLAELGLAK